MSENCFKWCRPVVMINSHQNVHPHVSVAIEAVACYRPREDIDSVPQIPLRIPRLPTWQCPRVNQKKT